MFHYFFRFNHEFQLTFFVVISWWCEKRRDSNSWLSRFTSRGHFPPSRYLIEPPWMTFTTRPSHPRLMNQENISKSEFIVQVSQQWLCLWVICSHRQIEDHEGLNSFWKRFYSVHDKHLVFTGLQQWAQHMSACGSSCQKFFCDKLPAITMMPNVMMMMMMMMMIWKCYSIQMFELMANYLLRYIYFTQCQQRHHILDAGGKLFSCLFLRKFVLYNCSFVKRYLLNA